MICILTRLPLAASATTCREILKVLLARAANYIIVRSDYFSREDSGGGDREVTITGDEFLSNQMDLANYVLNKGILCHELGPDQQVGETCCLLIEALQAVQQFS